jgi:hypothetical protein
MLMLLVQAFLEDNSVALEFMTDDASEAQEMRRQMLLVEGWPTPGYWNNRGGLRCKPALS